MTDEQDEKWLELSAEEKLRILCDDRKNASGDYQKGFYEGRMLEITRGLKEHPEWFDYGCLCELCCS